MYIGQEVIGQLAVCKYKQVIILSLNLQCHTILYLALGVWPAKGQHFMWDEPIKVTIFHPLCRENRNKRYKKIMLIGKHFTMLMPSTLVLVSLVMTGI